jgi:hypothetical protein
MEYIGNPTCKCDPDRCENCKNWPFQWAADFSTAVWSDDECDYCDEAAQIYVLTNAGSCLARYREVGVCTVTIGAFGDFDLDLHVLLELIPDAPTSFHYRLTIWWALAASPANPEEALAFGRWETSAFNPADPSEEDCFYLASGGKIDLSIQASDWSAHGFGFVGLGAICSGAFPDTVQIWSADA